MVAPGRPALAPALLLLALVSVVSLAGILPLRAPAPDMRGWGIADLLRHLEGRGVRFHPCPTRENGPITWNVYLTREERFWTDHGRHGVDPRRVERWSGVVYCEVGPRQKARESEFASWGECGLRAGPFLFFGDPGMLAEIRDVLGVGS